MRKFKLWNSLKSESFDFDSNDCIISDVSGLGVTFKLIEIGRSIAQSQAEFDEIILKVNYGVKTNPYTAYTSFVGFLKKYGNKKMILEYETNAKYYAEVYLLKMPKSQISTFNIMIETIQLKRVSHWYTELEVDVPDNPNSMGVANDFFEDIPVKVTIVGPTSSDFELRNISTGDKVALISPLVSGQTMVIDGWIKKIKDLSGNNLYNQVNKEFNTFLVVSGNSVNNFSVFGTAADVKILYKKQVI